jgi:hypothetical protein
LEEEVLARIILEPIRKPHRTPNGYLRIDLISP